MKTSDDGGAKGDACDHCFMGDAVEGDALKVLFLRWFTSSTESNG